jgi:hypothetical protein
MVYKPTGERKLFELIWSISDKRSFISGRKLPFEVGSDLWFSCFAHVLSKKQWPYFRLYIGNVSTLHPDEHMIYDKGTIDDQKKYTRDWPLTKWDELVRLKAGLTRERHKWCSDEVVSLRNKRQDIHVKLCATGKAC